MMKNKILFDLIVTSRETSSKFKRFNESLFQQDGSIFMRVIFVDQMSGNTLSRGSSGNVIAETISTDKISISKARNLAISKGLKGLLVCFPDDDCWYDKGTLLRVSKAFDADGELDCLCVNVNDPIRNKNYGHRPKEVVKKINYSNIFRLPISVGIFIRTDTFNEIESKFCENLGAGTFLGSGEETAIIYELLKLNKKIVYDGSISVFHEISCVKTSNEKVLSYARGYGYLASKIISEGHKSTLIDFMATIFKSICAIIIFGFISNKSKFYFLRILGIYQGIIINLKESGIK